jgi:hypothetical protein
MSKTPSFLPPKAGQPGRLPDGAAIQAKGTSVAARIKAVEILKRGRIPLVFTGENPGIRAAEPIN